MTIKYKGYEVTQVEYNNHIWVKKDGETAMHISCDCRKTENELREVADECFEIMKLVDHLRKQQETDHEGIR